MTRWGASVDVCAGRPVAIIAMIATVVGKRLNGV
jgi:hypothetical protein